jgi:hypothetical protein
MSPKELQEQFDGEPAPAPLANVAARFQAANKRLRNENVSNLLAGGKGDPRFDTMTPEERAELKAMEDNQQAQLAQAEVRQRATTAQTVQVQDAASQSGQPAFVQSDPNQPMPEVAPVAPTGNGFTRPQAQRPRAAQPGEVIEQAKFIKPEYYGVETSQVGPGMTQAAPIYRDPSQAMAAARLLGLQPAKEAQGPIRVDPNSDPMYRTQQQTNYTTSENYQEHRPVQQVVVVNDVPGVIPDLEGAILQAVEALGESDAARYFQTSVAIVRKWKKGEQNPSVKHLQILLADPLSHKLPEVRSTVECLVRINMETGDYGLLSDRPKVPLMIGMCIKGDMSQAVHYALMALNKRWDVNYVTKADTLLVSARNQVVDLFLSTNNQWLLMLDSDVIPPIGNAEWFRDITKWNNMNQTGAGYDIIQRLLSHNKDIVGGVYAGRAIGMPLIIQSDLQPKPGSDDKETATRIRKGQSRGLIEQDWVPTGCMLIRRNVFEGIRKRFPNLAPKTNGRGESWGWFDHDHTSGEDVAFCNRARQSGFKVHLDTELICGHIGRICYGLEHSGPVRLQSM